MDLILYCGLFIVSLAVLLKASDWFIDSAELIGLSFGISPFIIGVTIIAFGTSLPELAASIASVYANESEIVVGNVVGSNITNILLVLSLTAVLGKEIILDYDVMDIDMPLLIGSAFLLWFALLDSSLSVFEAILFIGGLVAFLVTSIKSGKTKPNPEPINATTRNYIFMVIGAVLVYFGATYTILAIQGISEIFNVNPEIISLTGVALGTSLPEVFVSITAARKGLASIAVGNVLGSNIFNTYAVMGVPRLFGDLEIPGIILSFSLPFMIACTLLFGFVCLSKRISRWEGSMLFAFYVYFIYETLERGIL